MGVLEACCGPCDLVALPPEVVDLLVTFDAPSRLAAHLRAVHDVAVQLLDAIESSFPTAAVNRHEVAFGAATHDIGKARITAELTGPGSEHERTGYQMLVEHGVPEALARFARTHAQWDSEAATFEDLLVSLADKVWKGRREEKLEKAVVQQIAAATAIPAWEVFMVLDDVLTHIAQGADARMAFQNQFSAAP